MFFVPTLLRLTIAGYFFYMARFVAREKRELVGMKVPVVGTMREWMVWAHAALLITVGGCLFVGWNTQWAAIIGILLVFKHLLGLKHYHQILPFTRATYILLLIICVSLLWTGAGALAFDLPL